MKALVCGGRKFNNFGLFAKTIRLIQKHYPISIFIEGNAPGADKLCGTYCSQLGLPCAKIPANWNYYDKRAGSLRNGWMLLLKPDFVIAFPGGSGTQNMVTQALENGIFVLRIDINGNIERLNPDGHIR